MGEWDKEMVLFRMGLLSPDQAYLDGVAKLLAGRDELGIKECAEAIRVGRGTGRTTRIVASAVACALNGGMAQLRHVNRMIEEDLVVKGKHWVEKLGGDPSLLIGYQKGHPGEHVEFWDPS
uniref:Uncharacterized protein n=1 Tax=viral metagenome TaxID=1070528 RepID=A0A6H1Z987_9ZZZZ